MDNVRKRIVSAKIIAKYSNLVIVNIDIAFSMHQGLKSVIIISSNLPTEHRVCINQSGIFDLSIWDPLDIQSVSRTLTEVVIQSQRFKSRTPS